MKDEFQDLEDFARRMLQRVPFEQSLAELRDDAHAYLRLCTPSQMLYMIAEIRSLREALVERVDLVAAVERWRLIHRHNPDDAGHRLFDETSRIRRAQHTPAAGERTAHALEVAAEIAKHWRQEGVNGALINQLADLLAPIETDGAR